MFERVVVGVTKESTAKNAAQRAEQLAAAFGAELHLVTAFEHRGDDGSAERAEKMLDNLATASGSRMQIHSRPGDAASAICAVARDVEADLIVVGNKGLSDGNRWSKSVPGEVSRTAPCSVLILDTI